MLEAKLNSLIARKLNPLPYHNEPTDASKNCLTLWCPSVPQFTRPDLTNVVNFVNILKTQRRRNFVWSNTYFAALKEL